MKAIAYQKLTVTDAVAALTVPQGALVAVMIAEADATAANTDKCMRYREDGPDPTNTDGMPIGDMWMMEVRGGSLAAFRAIGIEAAKSHTLNITYYA